MSELPSLCAWVPHLLQGWLTCTDLPCPGIYHAQNEVRRSSLGVQ